MAIILVFLIHFAGSFSSSHFVHWGWIGVDIFFVLSGFLITGILDETLTRPDFFRNFYIRRALRIFPLYYGMWAFFLLLTPVLHIEWNRYDLSYLAYIANFFVPAGVLGLHANINMLDFQRHGHTSHILLGQLWSVCVEEQFYLVWPAVMYAVRSRRTLLRICLVLIVAGPLMRMLYLHMEPASLLDEGIYKNTLCRVDTLLFGAATALWLREHNPAHATVRKVAYSVAALPILLLAVLYHLQPHRPQNMLHSSVVGTIGLSLVALSSVGLLLLSIDPETWVARVFRQTVLVWLGRISYGLYLIHGAVLGIVVTWYARVPGPYKPVSACLLGIAATVLIAWASFRFFESPFLQLKKRFAPRTGAADNPPPFPESQHLERA